MHTSLTPRTDHDEWDVVALRGENFICLENHGQVDHLSVDRCSGAVTRLHSDLHLPCPLDFFRSRPEGRMHRFDLTWVNAELRPEAEVSCAGRLCLNQCCVVDGCGYAINRCGNPGDAGSQR